MSKLWISKPFSSFLKNHFQIPFKHPPLKTLGAPGAVHTLAREEADRWTHDRTGQSLRGGGGVDCAVLAAGELAGGEVIGSGFHAERRTSCASLGHRRSSRVTSTARMAGRWRGSPTTHRSQPWRGWVRSARGPRSQSECENTRNWRKRRE
jgi:hypothetical protein